MSYVRMGPDSDVYVMITRHGLECCACILDKDRQSAYYLSNQEMIVHLLVHRLRDHKVPQSAFDRLKNKFDAVGNERYLKTGDTIWLDDDNV